MFGINRLYKVYFATKNVVFLMVLTSLLGLTFAQVDDLSICKRSRVVEGTNGWLFYENDLVTDIPVDGEMVKELANAFNYRGIDVVFLALPPRALFAAAGLPKKVDYRRKQALKGYRVFLNTFEEAGFRVVRLDGLDKTEYQNFFFLRDHHWTPYGAEVSAKKVRELLEDTPFINNSENQFRTYTEETLYRIGSQAGNAERNCNVLFEPEPYEKFVTELLQEPIGLFDSIESSGIVLVGSSNSRDGNDRHNNFEGFLKQQLNMDLVNYSITGGGDFKSIEDYVLSDAYNDIPPDLIVWETLLAPGTPDNVNFSDKRRFQQLIPSVYGSCSNNSLITKEIPIVYGEPLTYKLLESGKISRKRFFFPLPSLKSLNEINTFSFSAKLSVSNSFAEKAEESRNTVSVRITLRNGMLLHEERLSFDQNQPTINILSNFHLTDLEAGDGIQIRLAGVGFKETEVLEVDEVELSFTNQIIPLTDQETNQLFGKDFYLHLVVSDISLSTIFVNTVSKSGVTKGQTIERAPNVSKTQDFYFWPQTSLVEELSLGIPSNVESDSLKVYLCPFPG